MDTPHNGSTGNSPAGSDESRSEASTRDDNNGYEKDTSKTEKAVGVDEIFEIVASVVFIGLGGWISNDFPNVGLIVAGLGYVIVVHVLKLRLTRKWGPNVWFPRVAQGLSFLIVLMMGLILFARSRDSHPVLVMPKLEVGFRSPEFSSEVVFLTNTVFKVESFDERLPGSPGHLTIPRTSKLSGEAFDLIVSNSSPVTAREVQVYLFLDPDLNCDLSPRWGKGEAAAVVWKGTPEAEVAMNTWYHKSPFLLHSGDSLIFSDIRFRDVKFSHRFNFFLLIKASNTAPSGWRLGVSFESTNRIQKPTLGFAQHYGDGLRITTADPTK